MHLAAQHPVRVFARMERCVVAVYRQRKSDIAQGVLVSAVHGDCIGQRENFVEALGHDLGCAFEQFSAPTPKNRVAAEQILCSIISNVIQRVAG